MKKSIILFISFIFSHQIFAVIPPENITYPVSLNKELLKPLTESDLVEVSSHIQNLYQDFINRNYHSKLIMDNDWNDETVNSFASRPVDGEFHIHISGGIVRAKGMTKDALALVICHEVGHHLGGAPRTNLYNGWPSAEGQADYWATSKCLKRYFYDLKNEDVDVTSSVPEKVIQDCNKIYNDFVSMKVCVRSILASMDFANFLNQLPSTRVKIDFQTPDSKIVRGTNINDYPRPQCRFDTLYQGALCNISFNEVTSPNDPNVASCVDQDALGARPRCWFAR